MRRPKPPVEPTDALLSDPDNLPLEQFLTYQLQMLTSRLNRQAIDLLDKTCGLRLPEWRCLAIIGRDGRVSLATIAEATEWTALW